MAAVLLSLLAPGFIPAQLSTVRADEPPNAPKEAGEVRVRGQLQFKSRKVDFDGTSVGREGDPRRYIAGHPDSPQRGIWQFETLPKSLTTAPGDVVKARFKCSHFVLQDVGTEAQVVIRVVTHTRPQAPPDRQQKGEWQWADNTVGPKGRTPREQYQDDVAAYRARMIDPADAEPGTEGWKAANELAEKYGYYEVRLPKVFDLQETTFDLPAGLFRNATKNAPKAGPDGTRKRPLVSVYVGCETAGLLLGMCETDLYLVERTAAKR
jgi:hypothetical protein